MKNILKYAACLAVAAFSFTGCEDPDTTEKLPYYYTESIAYLNQETDYYLFGHTINGVIDQDIPFTVGVTKKSSKPYKIVLEAEVEGIDASKVSFPDGIALTIPAGASSVESKMKIDWSFAESNDGAIDATIKIKIKSANTVIAEEKNELTYAIRKNVKTNVYTDVPAGTQIDRSGWTVSRSTNPDLDEWKTTTKLTDGGNYTYEYTYNYLGILVDFGSAQTITGMASYCGYGAYYSPTLFTLDTSSDGNTWTTQGQDIEVEKANYIYAAFYEPVTTRYVRIRFYCDPTGTNKNVMSSEIYAYAE